MSSNVKENFFKVDCFDGNFKELPSKVSIALPNGNFLVVRGKDTIMLSEGDFLFFAAIAGTSIIVMENTDDKSDRRVFDLALGEGNEGILIQRPTSPGGEPDIQAPLPIPPSGPKWSEDEEEEEIAMPNIAHLSLGVLPVSHERASPAPMEEKFSPVLGRTQVPLILEVPRNEEEVVQKTGYSTAELLAKVNYQSARKGLTRSTRLRFGSLYRAPDGGTYRDVVMHLDLVPDPPDSPGHKLSKTTFSLLHDKSS